MKRRLYFLLPDINRTQQAVNELVLSHVEERHIHVLAKEGATLDELPEATLFQKSDLIHGMELGLSIGGLTGALVGLLAVTLAPSSLAVNGGALLACTLAGALIGVWASGMIGINVPNSRLKAFEHALEEGQILLMVDVPKGQVDHVIDLVKKHHPEAHVGGTEPTIPAFP